MPNQILKYKLEISLFIQPFSLPWPYQFLSAQLQGGDPVFWIMADLQSKPVRREFTFYHTGDAVDDGWTYLQTIQIGCTVWHLYEKNYYL